MTGRSGRGLASVTKGKRPDHPTIRATSTLWQLEQATRQPYPGVCPVPAAGPIFDWRVCGCDWSDPIVDGRRVLQADNPRYQWSEETAQGLKSLAREVRRLVLLYGGGYFHAKDAFRSFPGYPDAHIHAPGVWTPEREKCQFVTRPREIVREIKPPAGWKFYGPQLATMTTMRLAGKDVGTWSSCCLLSGRISAEIREVTGAQDIHPEDVYGLDAPGGRPAVSGPVAYFPGTIPHDPPAANPMSDGSPMGAPAPARLRGGPSAAGSLDGVDGEYCDGYVVNPVGMSDPAAGRAVGRLNAWATGWGVDAGWPLKIVITSALYLVRERSGAWKEVVRLPASTVNVVELVESLNPRRVAASSVPACQALLSPGRRPATPGGTP